MWTLLAGLSLAAPLERLDLGASTSTRFGDPTTLAQPVELTVSTFVTPWLGFEGRAGLSPTWNSYSLIFTPDGHVRPLLTAGIRFGRTTGIYGGPLVGVWLPRSERHPDPSDADTIVGAWGGWRFKLGKQVYIAPEAYVGTFYGGLGIHLEFVAIRK